MKKENQWLRLLRRPSKNGLLAMTSLRAPKGRGNLRLDCVKKTRAIFLVLFFLFPVTAYAAKDSAWVTLGRIPVQHDGRIKPFESFAREAVFDVTGSSSTYEGFSPVELVWRWMATPEIWNTKAMIPVAYRPLHKEFKPMLIEKRLSPEIIMQHKPFIALVQEAFEKQRVKDDLTQMERERMMLYSKARLFQEVAAGTVPGWIAHPDDPRIGWLAFDGFGTAQGQTRLSSMYPPALTAEVNGRIRDLLLTISESEVPVLKVPGSKQVLKNEPGTFRTGTSALAFERSLQNLFDSRGVVMDTKVLKAEMRYNKLKPFGWAWKIYLLTVLVMFVCGFLGDKVRLIAGVATLGCGFLMHTYGFYLRCTISGRPPVTNMYESIVWVSWGVILLALILFVVYRAIMIPMTAAFVGMLALVVANSFPAVLNPEISPLVPVLRSTLWLTVHVLTITLSYGAFMLAWGLGHVVLFRYATEPDKPNKNREISQFVYRAVQVGVILLAAGTVLGGVWANYSWGRFWGWDPKETWALIALIGYLIVLHGRFSGLYGVFGVAVGSVVAFLGVVMAWYGVNYVLAAGLHSYGFGGGGAPYVLGVALLDLALVGGIVYRYLTKKKSVVIT